MFAQEVLVYLATLLFHGWIWLVYFKHAVCHQIHCGGLTNITNSFESM